MAGHASCTKLIKLASRCSAFSFFSSVRHANAKCRSLSRDVFSKLINIHAFKIPWFTHLLAINNQASHLRLAQCGRNGCRRLIDLGRELAGLLKLVKERYHCDLSASRSISRCALNKLINPRRELFITFQPTSVPVILFVARQNISLASRLPLRQLLGVSLPSWITKNWHWFSQCSSK